MSDLNLRWEWRLVKVLYFILSVIVVILSTVVLFLNIPKTYSPAIIDKIDKSFLSFEQEMQMIYNQVEALNGDYSTQNVSRLVKDWKIHPDILYSMLIDEGKNIDWIYIACVNKKRNECTVPSITETSFSNVMSTWFTLSIPENDIKEFQDKEYRYMDIVLARSEAKKSDYLPLIQAYNQIASEKVKESPDYIEIKEYSGIILYLVIEVFILFLLGFLVKAFIWYIAFGKLSLK